MAQHTTAWDDLVTARERIWSLLARAAVDKKSPMNTPTVATVAHDASMDGTGGGAGLFTPALRTVVLRSWDGNGDGHGPTLTFHTDIRSAKVAEIRAQPRVAWHVWHPGERLQLRIDTHAHLHHDDMTSAAAWQALHDGSRRVYAQTTAPATRLDGPGDVTVAADIADGRANFAVVVCAAHRLEWLHLGSNGHRRGAFTWPCDADGHAGRGPAHATWLAP